MRHALRKRDESEGRSSYWRTIIHNQQRPWVRSESAVPLGALRISSALGCAQNQQCPWVCSELFHDCR